MLEQEFIVEANHSAIQMGSGDLEVLSTPSMIAFMESVAKDLIAKELEANQTSVGIDLNIQHLRPTAISQKIRVTATLLEQKKKILFYEVQAFEGETLIGKGTHKRVIVEIQRFMESL